MNDDLKTRLGGAILLILGSGFGWWAVVKPYQAAVAGAPEVTYSLKAVLLIPLCLVFGLFFLVFGTRFVYRNAAARTMSPLGWALFGVVVVLAGLAWWWLETRFAALGYN